MDGADAVTKRNYALFRRYYSSLLNGRQTAFRWPVRGDWPFALLKNLFATFDGAAPQSAEPDDGGREEWNPFSQRPVLSAYPDRPGTSLNAFERTQQLSGFLMNTAHESMHIALWEPFFVGASGAGNAAAFVRRSLCFEGFCFWFADIAIGTRIRDRYPDGELAWSRRALSMAEFHPSRAFKALGIRDPEEILGIYLEAFSGYRTRLLSAGDSYSRALARRVYRFYRDGRAISRRQFATLKQADLLDGFRERFCEIPGLPSLIDPALARGLEKDELSYCLSFRKEAFRQIGACDRRRIADLKFRRRLQTRAYFAMTLRHALATRNFIAARSPVSARERGRLVGAVDDYLVSLESRLASLAGGSPGRALEADLRAADAYFEKEVRKSLTGHGLWTARIEQQNPPDRVGRGQIAVNRRPTLREARAHLKWLAAALFQSPKTLGALEKATARKLGALWALLNCDSEAKFREHADRFRDLHNSVVADPALLPFWSKPLDSIAPLEKKFRELLMNFE